MMFRRFCDFKLLVYINYKNNRFDKQIQKYKNILFNRRLLQVIYCNDRKFIHNLVEKRILQ